MKRLTKKRLTNEKYLEIKSFLNKYPNFSNDSIAKITQVSHTTISRIRHTKNYSDYRAFIADAYKRGNKKSINLQPDKDILLDAKLPITSVSDSDSWNNISDSLDKQLAELDIAIDSLKKKIENVIVAAMDSRIAEYKAEKEAEIKALKTVVEAAKSSNLATSLKRRLMGA